MGKVRKLKSDKIEMEWLMFVHLLVIILCLHGRLFEIANLCSLRAT